MHGPSANGISSFAPSDVAAQRLTVVLPTLNEVDNLRPMVEALLGLSCPRIDLAILVVDSASPDGTGELADVLAGEHPGRVAHLPFGPGRGLGRAYTAGFGRALADGAELVLQMDADFSHPPRFVPELLRVLQADPADMVLGSRYAPGGRLGDDWPRWRRWLSTFANSLYLRAALGLPLHDATGGFRLWRRETLLGLGLDRVASEGYVFQVEMASLALALGYRVVETPIEFMQRRAGSSKMSWRIQAEAAWRVFALRARHARLSPADRRSVASTAPAALAAPLGATRRAVGHGSLETAASPEAAA